MKLIINQATVSIEAFAINPPCFPKIKAKLIIEIDGEENEVELRLSGHDVKREKLNLEFFGATKITEIIQ